MRIAIIGPSTLTAAALLALRFDETTDIILLDDTTEPHNAAELLREAKADMLIARENALRADPPAAYCPFVASTSTYWPKIDPADFDIPRGRPNSRQPFYRTLPRYRKRGSHRRR